MDLKTLQYITSTHSTPSPVHFRAIFPNSHAGCLVGPGGIITKELIINFDTYLHVNPVLGLRWGQLVTTRGQPESLSEGLHQCAKNLTERYPEFYQKFGFRIDFIFPSDFVNMFLMTGQFERIAKESNTCILVKYDCLMRSTERMVRISTCDTEEQSLLAFKNAVHLLATVVQENISMAMCSPGNVYYIQELQDDLWSYAKEDLKKDILFTPVQ